MSQKRSDKQAEKTVPDPPTPFQLQRATRLQEEEEEKKIVSRDRQNDALFNRLRVKITRTFRCVEYARELPLRSVSLRFDATNFQRLKIEESLGRQVQLEQLSSLLRIYCFHRSTMFALARCFVGSTVAASIQRSEESFCRGGRDNLVVPRRTCCTSRSWSLHSA